VNTRGKKTHTLAEFFSRKGPVISFKFSLFSKETSSEADILQRRKEKDKEGSRKKEPVSGSRPQGK